VKWFFKIQDVKKFPPTRVKRYVCEVFSITSLVLHLEEHSKAHCKAYEILFLTIYNPQLLDLQSVKWLHVMNTGN
jgi:hypothetical protein